MQTLAPCRIGLVGFSGRMGRYVLDALTQSSTCTLGALLVHRTPAPPALAHLACTDLETFVQKSDVVLDFSAPAACARLAPACTQHHKAYVVASTALAPDAQAALQQATEKIAVVQSANMSIGINVMLGLVKQAAQALPQFDVEISEIHHRHKRDAPSGTALLLGEAVQAGRPQLALQPVLARSGEQARRNDDLGYAALRGGDVAGEHTVFFFGEGERIEITHRSTRGQIFATGALAACHWVRQQNAGLYSMQDVLGLPPLTPT